uniref:Uncharacterized protein LOC105034316 n=1 Tax=Elaeis guineensis var. tenera TaxID=51953 RepID=A0A6I9QDV4_ELAGV
APCSSAAHPHHGSRKRSSATNPLPHSYHHHHHHLHASSLALIDPSRFSSSPTAASAGGDVVYPSSSTPPPHHLHPHLVLSGGKEDLGALAMLEDSVKKLKSPKTSPGPALAKAQVDSALSLLSDWFYESCGAVSLSSAEHPKFRSFLHQVGLPPLSRRDLAGPRLDARFEEARADADARIRDALFFQLSSDGWRPRDATATSDALVSLAVNLPNGTSVFHRAVLSHGGAPSKYAEEVLWDTVADVCGSAVQRCAGIVSDRFKSKALRNLETQNHWMVNLYCQLQGFHSLIKDFALDLPLCHSVAINCCKLATFFNTNNQARGIFHKYQLQQLDHASLLRVPPSFDPSAESGSHGREIVRNFAPVFAMLEDIMAAARALQLAVLDESFKMVCVEDSTAREVGEMIVPAFWSDLDAVYSLVKLVKDVVQEMETERPLVGQCLLLWDDLRAKVKEWCNKFSMEEGPVKKVVERRFDKNYHPAWSAAFILDPLYLIKDSSGKYLPPFKCLTPEQEKDVDKLITRMVSREEAHIALMELMKWRAEGLDPLYAQAVQVKKLDPMTGKMRIANPQSSRLVWETYLSEFKTLGKVAVRLIFLHATSCGFKCNLSLLRCVRTHGRSRGAMDRAQKLAFVAAHAKLERRDFSNEEEKDAELFDDGEDDVLNEPTFVDASSV